ncbi:hypothetical protein ES332_A05G353100v1 [Gossypium tomentosum]|uniref:non-specific serine/threonine protein kinase n=1 Tax=Gossypium tomentosum TaxID=34277 RepID=A0A5D2QRD6_GOSTO|nr:hypothetical protein ES332_A05G353100v1 [Gossypium tomentosum]
MSDTKETTRTNDTSFTIYSPSSKHNASSSDAYKSNKLSKPNDDSPPSNKQSPKVEPPKTSPPPPQEEKHSPPPPLGEKHSPPPPLGEKLSPPPPSPAERTNSPPKQPPKSSPSPSPQSSSGSPPTPPKQESPPSTTPQSPPQPLPTQKPPPSPTHEPLQSSPKNSPPESQPTESSSDSKPSLAPSSPETSKSPPSTNSTSTSINGSEESMPAFSPKTAVVPPSPSSSISPSNPVGGSSNNNSESTNNRQRTIDLRHPSYGIVIGVAIASIVVIAFIAFSFIRDRRKTKQKSHSTNFVAPPANISVTLDVTKGHPTQNENALSNSQHSWDSRKGQNHTSPGSGIISPSKTSFSYDEMMEMTNGFAQQNLIGEGGFGCVYKGQLLGGKIVAVKQLKIGSGQGEREFQAEVEIISRVHHQHLVSLVGYCIANNHRLLIYEFVSNSNLERHLHDSGLSVLEWAKRVKIAIGAAKGLAYLHEDLKSKGDHQESLDIHIHFIFV